MYPQHPLLEDGQESNKHPASVDEWRFFKLPFCSRAHAIKRWRVYRPRRHRPADALPGACMVTANKAQRSIGKAATRKFSFRHAPFHFRVRALRDLPAIYGLGRQRLHATFVFANFWCFDSAIYKCLGLDLCQYHAQDCQSSSSSIRTKSFRSGEEAGPQLMGSNVCTGDLHKFRQ